MSKFYWGSRCAECGRVMSSGVSRQCKKGGECSWHVPVAVRSAMEKMYGALQEIERHHVEQNRLKGRPEERSHTLEVVRAALAKVDGAQ